MSTLRALASTVSGLYRLPNGQGYTATELLARAPAGLLSSSIQIERIDKGVWRVELVGGYVIELHSRRNHPRRLGTSSPLSEKL